LPGIPSYVELMLPQLKEVLVSGKKIVSLSCDAKVRESAIANELSNIQDKYPDIDIGSYPYSKEGDFGTMLVMRGVDEAKILRCKQQIDLMIKNFIK